MILGGLPCESFEQRREVDKREHESRVALLRSVAGAVEERSTRRDLAENDLLYLYLKDCSVGEKLLFRRVLTDYQMKMKGCTALIEARLVGFAIEDFDRGDYRSSRLKPYEWITQAIAGGENDSDRS